jgi:hypothetical protein
MVQVKAILPLVASLELSAFVCSPSEIGAASGTVSFALLTVTI